MTGIRILKSAHYVPARILTNEEISGWVDTSDEWIVKRTGISERRISGGENTAQMATFCAEKLLAGAGLVAADIDIILVATCTGDYMSPSVACMVAGALDARAIAFDINAACTGFVYGLSIAAGMLRGGVHRRAMVIGVELLSKMTDWQDRNTCILFGDGAGGLIIEHAPERLFAEKLHARGDMPITMGYRGVFNPFFKDTKEWQHLQVAGREVFDFAVSHVSENIGEVLALAGLTLDDIALIFPHQANGRIIEGIAKKLKVDISKFFVNIEKYGNTSSASIGICLSEAFANGRIKSGDKIILAGFGGGLTWGCVLLEV